MEFKFEELKKFFTELFSYFVSVIIEGKKGLKFKGTLFIYPFVLIFIIIIYLIVKVVIG